jgi:hypothetical protein
MAPESERIPALQASQSVDTTLRLEGPAIAGDQVPATLLAAYALGVGKGSSVFRVLRQQDRISYRQEAYLQGEGSYFRLCVACAFLPRDDEAKLAEQTREQLLADVDQWGDGERARALALANTTLTGWPELVPMNLTGQGPVGSQDRAFLEAYWPMKTGDPWDPEALLAKMNAVSLADMKTAAKSALRSAQATLVSAR